MRWIKKRLVALYNWGYDRALDIGLFFRWRKDLALQKKLGLPSILTIDETLDRIIEDGVSVCRYGDGEFMIMDGEKIFFQSENAKLSSRLKEIIHSDEKNILICLPTYLDRRHKIVQLNLRLHRDARKRRRMAEKFLDNLLSRKRETWNGYFQKERPYGNALVTRCYVTFRDYEATRYFVRWKQLWHNRKVLIVEGEQTRFGVGNDLLKGAASVRRILCPTKSAFSCYDTILKRVLELHNPDELVLAALGPTATVLAYDLARNGIQAVDIGHLDIEYEWFLRGDRSHKRIEGKFVSEAKDGDQVEACKDERYRNEIIDAISIGNVISQSQTSHTVN